MALIEDFDSLTSSVAQAPQMAPAAFEDPSNLLKEIDVMQGKMADKDASEDIFQLDAISCPPMEAAGLRDMQVSNSKVIIALANCHVLRLSLDGDGAAIETIPVTKKQGDQIHRVFMDPTGTHVIISMQSAENWYLHSSWTKTKFLTKMKGLIVNCVAWNKRNSDPCTTREILFGTDSGGIFETCIESREKLFVECKEKNFGPVYNMGDTVSVTGLEFCRFPPAPSEPPKYLVLATTPTRIYQFIGGPSFLNIFEHYVDHAEFQDIPGDLSHSVLQLYTQTTKARDGSVGMGLPATRLPTEFAWLTGPGIFYGRLSFGSQNPRDKVLCDTVLMPYPATKVKYSAVPLDIVITEFHWVLLYTSKIQAISKLNERIVWEKTFTREMDLGHIRGVCRDVFKNEIWFYSAKRVFEILVNREDRNIWSLYLENDAFDDAERYCATDAQRDIVWSARAEYYFKKGNYKLAATFYGKTRKSFEEITLKFIRMQDRDALKTYLLQKLDNLLSTDATQRTVICTWLVEIYLNKLNQLKDERKQDAHDLLQDEFKQFLEDNSESFYRPTTYNLISSHGRVEELLHFATLCGDYELVISHYIQRMEYTRALEMLSRQSNEELYYKFSPVLMQHIPEPTVSAWICMPSLLAGRLIPALLRYEPRNNPPGNNTHQGIRYLQHCVTRMQNKDPAVHNFLLSLFVKAEDESMLLEFLDFPDAAYDREYALRLCTKEDKTRACVLIYSSMGLYEEAVELALKVDLQLAQDNADKSQEDAELRKKLWLRIARHVVEKEKNIKQAMAFLSRVELLKIEDILPFFPEFTLIDDFKEEICGALEEYNVRIKELKNEMDDATHSADVIRRDIKRLRNKYGFVGQNQKCDLCGYPVLTRQFYLFPCLHVYHGDCLANKTTEHLTVQQKQRVAELQALIAQAAPQMSLMDTVGSNRKEAITSELDKYKGQLDEIVASDCALCSHIMIGTINQPFISAADRAEIDSWRV